jgi:hypothetical protein
LNDRPGDNTSPSVDCAFDSAIIAQSAPPRPLAGDAAPLGTCLTNGAALYVVGTLEFAQEPDLVVHDLAADAVEEGTVVEVALVVVVAGHTASPRAAVGGAAGRLAFVAVELLGSVVDMAFAVAPVRWAAAVAQGPVAGMLAAGEEVAAELGETACRTQGTDSDAGEAVVLQRWDLDRCSRMKRLGRLAVALMAVDEVRCRCKMADARAVEARTTAVILDVPSEASLVTEMRLVKSCWECAGAGADTVVAAVAAAAEVVAIGSWALGAAAAETPRSRTRACRMRTEAALAVVADTLHTPAAAVLRVLYRYRSFRHLLPRACR